MLIKSIQYYEHSELVESLVKPSKKNNRFYVLDLSNDMTTLDCSQLRDCNEILKPSSNINALHLAKQFGRVRFIIDTLFAVLCRYEQSTDSLFSVTNNKELSAALNLLTSFEADIPEETGNLIVNALFKESLGFYKHTMEEKQIESRFVMSFDNQIKQLIITLLQILCETKSNRGITNVFIIDPDCKLMSEVVTNILTPILRQFENESCRVTHNHKCYSRDAKIWAESVNRHSIMRG